MCVCVKMRSLTERLDVVVRLALECLSATDVLPKFCTSAVLWTTTHTPSFLVCLQHRLPRLYCQCFTLASSDSFDAGPHMGQYDMPMMAGPIFPGDNMHYHHQAQSMFREWRLYC